MQRDELTFEIAACFLSYHPVTGEFRWLKRPSNRVHVGDVAGYIDPLGYVTIRLGGNLIKAHRLAFLLMTGRWPASPIDHINGVTADNSWENLREVSVRVNAQNMRKARVGSKSGLLGAHWDAKTGRWLSQIRIEGSNIHLGFFKSAQSAHEAYVLAKRVLHEGCTI